MKTQENAENPRKNVDARKTRRGRPRSITKSRYEQCELDFEGMQRVITDGDHATIAGQLRAMLEATRVPQEHWRGMIAVPPGTLLEEIVQTFQATTNIPLEIPFFLFLSAASGLLLQHDTVLCIGRRTVTPNLWTILLAASGDGKTFTRNVLTEVTEGTKNEFPGTGIISAAKFVEELSNKNNRLWVRDEFAGLLRAIENPVGPMGEMKDYLLRLYDHDTIERKGKKETVSVTRPSLSILGLNALGSFSENVTPEMMINGFAQRFQYVIARKDPQKKMVDYLWWDPPTEGWASRWQALDRAILPKYTATPELAAEAVKTSFLTCFHGKYQDMDSSFQRRILFAAHPYALLYHVLRVPTQEALTPEDYGWAGRLLSMHIQDLSFLIGEHNLSVVERMVVAVEAITQRVKVRHNRAVTPRDIVQGIASIKTTQQATSLLAFARQWGGHDDETKI